MARHPRRPAALRRSGPQSAFSRRRPRPRTRQHQLPPRRLRTAPRTDGTRPQPAALRHLPWHAGNSRSPRRHRPPRPCHRHAGCQSHQTFPKRPTPHTHPPRLGPRRLMRGTPAGNILLRQLLPPSGRRRSRPRTADNGTLRRRRGGSP